MKLKFSLLLGAVFCSVSAFAQDEDKALQAFHQAMTQEVMVELPADKTGDVEFILDKLIEKMRANLDDFKAAGLADCTTRYGEARKEACTCAIGKTDYDKGFDALKKIGIAGAGGDLQTVQQEEEKMLEESIAVFKSCGFSDEEMNNRRERAKKAAAAQG